MTITRRLVIILGLFFVVLTSRTVFFDRSLLALLDQTLILANETLVRQELAQEMTIDAASVAMLTTTYVASPGPELIEQMAAAEAEFVEKHATFAASASTRQLTDGALTVRRQFEDLIRQSGRIIDAVDRRERLEVVGASMELTAMEQAIDVYLGRFHILRQAIEGNLDNVIIPSTEADVEAAQRSVTAAIDQTRVISLGLGAAAGLIIVFVLWMTEKHIARPARRLVVAAQTLAAGAEPPPLPVQRDDELGRLTTVFNEMVRRQTESRRKLEDANAEMNAQNERLREYDRHKDHFIATVSHELRTPLTSIVGYTELLADGSVGDFEPEQTQFIQVVSRNAKRLQRMVDDLLLAAKIDAGTLQIERVPFDLGTLLAEAVESALPLAEDKGVTIHFQPIEPVSLIGDRTRLGQAIDNLLNNAIKFTPSHGSVELRGAVTSSLARIEVSDSGVGIPDDEQAHVFDRFFRSSTSSSVPGTGIGLSIVSFIAQAHDGSVEVESKMGMGSTFTMVIPRVNGHKVSELAGV